LHFAAGPWLIYAPCSKISPKKIQKRSASIFIAEKELGRYRLLELGKNEATVKSDSLSDLALET